MDSRRLADVRAGTCSAMLASGSGYLVGSRVVLTSRHVVVDESGTVRPRITVWLGHPAERRVQCSAVVLWGDRDRDLALLRLDIGTPAPDPPVRWGCFVGTEPVRYEGLAFPRFAGYESGPGVEQLGGYLPPLALGDSFRYILDQSAAPEITNVSEWGGASGAAIFCNDLLVAVVAKDDRSFGNRRLHATRLAGVLLDSDFAQLIAEDIGSWPAPEAVELGAIIRSPVRQQAARTPGSLLAADLEVVGFAGRTQIMADLTAWRDSRLQSSVALVVGEGGQGKTRLAREFARLSSVAGWLAGFTATASVQGDQRHRDSAEEVTRLLRLSNKPILIVTDYAETHPDYIEEIVNGLRSFPPRSAIRLLLLARGVNAWWESLAEVSPGEDMKLVVLPPLTSTLSDRRKIYGAAVAGLAQHLAGLTLDSTVSDGRPQDWARLAMRLVNQPPDLSDDRLRNALTLHMAALTDLLTAAEGIDPARTRSFNEQELVHHEFGYLRRTAARHGLFDRDVLSSRTDKHVRSREAWKLLERSLAGLILLGPADAERVLAIGRMASADRAADVISWLAALYPSPSGDKGIGSIQPDRLAELMLGRILTAESDLLSQIAEQVESYDDAIALLFIVLRTAAHPQFMQVRNQARTLILQRPVPFAEAALILTVNLAHVASEQGSEPAVAVLQAILQRNVSVPDSINPAALTNAIQLASERLTALQNAATDSVSPSEAQATLSTGRGNVSDQYDGLYQELTKGRPLFVRALLDVSLDVIGVSFDEARHLQKPIESRLAPTSDWDAAATLAALYDARYRQLVGLAMLLGNDVRTAEEVVQDAFESMLRLGRRLPDNDRILAYMRRVVINRSHRVLSHHRFEQLRSPELLPDVPGTEDESGNLIDRLAIVSALGELSKDQRDVIVLYYYADLSIWEIAEKLGISERAAQSRVGRARRALRELLKDSR